MIIIHHDAVNGVIGSCHELVYKPKSSVLIDCGLFWGAKTSGSGANANKLTINFPIDAIKALILTHVLAASGMCAFWREGGGASLPRTLRPLPCWQTLLFGRDVHAP